MIQSNISFSKLGQIYTDMKQIKIHHSDIEFIDSKIKIEEIDYYHTNPISRSSKTMSESKMIKNDSKLTGVL